MQHISVIIYEVSFQRGKMVDEFVVASEKYGSGSLERKYRFSEENGNLERIGRKREITSSFKQFFKVTISAVARGVWGHAPPENFKI